MQVRWMAVLTGLFVDILIGSVLVLLLGEQVFASPDLAQPAQVALFSLPIVLTAVSGYVAGRVAGTNHTLHGLLVQIVAILLAQLGGPIPRPLVISYALACLFAALGGALSRFPARRAAG